MLLLHEHLEQIYREINALRTVVEELRAEVRRGVSVTVINTAPPTPTPTPTVFPQPCYDETAKLQPSKPVKSVEEMLREAGPKLTALRADIDRMALEAVEQPEHPFHSVHGRMSDAPARDKSYSP